MFDETVLIDRLSRLSEHHRVAFAASCCERLGDNYLAYAKARGSAENERLGNHLLRIWEHVRGRTLSTEEVEDRVRECEQLMSDMEDPPRVFAELAEKALSSVAYTFQCCANPEPSTAALAGRMAVESVDAYLFGVAYPLWGNPTGVADHSNCPHAFTGHEVKREQLEFDSWIWKSALMVTELKKQDCDLDFLGSHPILSSGDVTLLRCTAHCVGLQLLKRGLFSQN